MNSETVANIEHHEATEHCGEDTTVGQLVIDNNGEVVKRFCSLADAQAFVNSLSDPDRFAIQRSQNTSFDIKQTAMELAESGEPDEEIAAEQQFEEDGYFSG